MAESLLGAYGLTDRDQAWDVLLTLARRIAVHRASLINATEEEIEQRVKVRMARQELLTATDAPQAWLS